MTRKGIKYKDRQFRRTRSEIAWDIQSKAKTCPECRVRKDFSEYQRNAGTVDGCHNICKACVSVQTRAYGKRDYVKRRRKDTNLKSLYGVSLEEKEALFEAQGRCCAICKSANPGASNKEFYLDHCHDTLNIRGVLCHNCNAGLGQFKDNPEIILNALEYLHAHWNRHRNNVGSQDDSCCKND